MKLVIAVATFLKRMQFESFRKMKYRNEYWVEPLTRRVPDNIARINTYFESTFLFCTLNIISL